MYNLSKLVELVNAKLKETGVENPVNERLVRHYTSERLVPVPLKEGKEARYTDDHVQALVALRATQSIGYSTKVLKNALSSNAGLTNSLSASASYYSSSTSEPKNEALKFLSNLGTGSDTVAKEIKRTAMASPDIYLNRNLVESAPEACFSAMAATNALLDSSPHVDTDSLAWRRIQVRDGLELNVREDLLGNINESDINLLTNKLNSLK